MGLFGFGKKKEEACDCGGACAPVASESTNEKECAVKVLGSGCTKCNDLEAAVKVALKELNMPVEVEHVKDFAQIAAFGVMTTPALVVNGKVVSMGKVLKADEAAKLIQSAQ